MTRRPLKAAQNRAVLDLLNRRENDHQKAMARADLMSPTPDIWQDSLRDFLFDALRNDDEAHPPRSS